MSKCFVLRFAVGSVLNCVQILSFSSALFFSFFFRFLVWALLLASFRTPRAEVASFDGVGIGSEWDSRIVRTANLESTQ